MTYRIKKIFYVVLFLCFLITPIVAAEDSDDSTKVVIYQEVFSSPDYLVTTGDVYTLTYNALTTTVNYTVVVDPTYKVKVSNLGIIDAKGKTFLELKKEVEEIVTSNYPMSAVQLVLSSPSTFKVIVRGEVNSVVELRVTGLARIGSVAFGNATGDASHRFVTVIDADGNENRYDLFTAQRFGDLSQNPYVRPNDTIILEKAERRVSISGSVERAGTYELLEGENLKTLIEYYGGGFDPLADTSNITLTRRLSDNSKAGEVLYLEEKVLSDDYELVHLDSVSIGTLSDLRNTIFIQGAVGIQISATTEGEVPTNNIRYQFEEGETYLKFVRSHKGWFTDVSDYERSYISRNGERVAIDLYSMLFNPEYEDNQKMKAGDILVVPFRQFFVTVSGAVKVPGRYAYVPDRTWEYYMNLAGGYDKTLNSPETIEIKTVDGRILSIDDYILPETTINAPTKLRVMIGGEVTKNQEITLDSSLMRLSSVVSGYRTSYSSSRFVTVKDKEGNVNRYDFFLMDRFGDLTQDPYVKDGDIITVERAGRRVSISGSVERPGTYELLKGENLKTLIEYYGGGLDPLADISNITLTRRLSDNNKAGEVLYLEEEVLSVDYELVHLDSVSIGNLSDLRNTVFIQGAVGVQISETTEGEVPTNNIRYQFEEGETYLKFVRTHKGWFTDVSDYERAYISRNGERVAIDLYSMLFNPEYEDALKMEAGDILVVPFRQFFVTVSGAVKVPGRYAYVPDRTWEYYVGLAGGFDPDLNVRDKISMTTNEGGSLTKADYILPETTIDAARNSFGYNFNKYATPILTILSIITSTILISSYISTF